MRDYKSYIILNAVEADGQGLSIDVKDFRHLIVAIASDNSFEGVIKCVGSISEDAPDFESAQGVSNIWDTVSMVDLEDGTHIPGDTGITFAGTDDVRLFEVDTNGLNWLNFVVSSYAAGDITVETRIYHN